MYLLGIFLSVLLKFPQVSTSNHPSLSNGVKEGGGTNGGVDDGDGILALSVRLAEIVLTFQSRTLLSELWSLSDRLDAFVECRASPAHTEY